MNTKTPKVVITDWTFANLSVEEALLREAGVEVVGRQCKSEAELIQLCADADAVITQFAHVNANVINTRMRARVIVRYGIGVDNVDLDVARRRGILCAASNMRVTRSGPRWNSRGRAAPPRHKSGCGISSRCRRAAISRCRRAAIS